MAASNTYDFIICGGGTSGCVVAGRLAEDPSVKILLIEAGEHSDNVPATQSAGGTFSMMGSQHDWQFTDEGNPGLQGRTIGLSRGKVLGGSSTINGTYCVRGPRADYDDWDLLGWSGDEVYKYMNKSESFDGCGYFTPAPGTHGTDGPLLTTPHPTAPISERIQESYLSKGLPWVDDPFSTGNSVHCSGYTIVSVGDGYRSTSALYVTKSNLRSNLTILSNTFVDKVNLDQTNEGRLHARSVEVTSSDGSKVIYSARHEIILSAGAYCTPPILLRSGIGPTEEVSKHGITPVLDLAGVGQNLQDHLLTYINYEVNDISLTLDRQMWHPEAAEKSAAEWQATKTGFFAQFPFNSFAYARLDDRLKDSEIWNNADRRPGRDPMGLDPKLQPSIELITSECWLSPPTTDQYVPPFDGSAVMPFLVLQFGLHSRGSVTLRSSNPTDNPVIVNNYLDNDLDAEVIAEACRFANEIATQGAGTKDIIKGSWPREHQHHKLTTREEWKEYARKYSITSFHPCGTCSMGKDGDPDAVLDAELRVRGVKGLRVADVSVIPTNVQGHTQMIAYAVGEKAADLLKAEYKLQ